MEQKIDLTNKFILDACCSGREMWFNKKHPNTIYIDIREEEKGFIKERPNFCIKPDIVMDFRKLKFPDKSFKLVVWDPPHMKARKLTGVMVKKYGGLIPETWQSDLKRGFKEIWRVLEDYGVLIFKWNNYHIKFKKVLSLFPIEPLFGNISTNTPKSQTKWFCFMKIPESVGQFCPSGRIIATKRDSDESPNSLRNFV